MKRTLVALSAWSAIAGCGQIPGLGATQEEDARQATASVHQLLSLPPGQLILLNEYPIDTQAPEATYRRLPSHLRAGDAQGAATLSAAGRAGQYLVQFSGPVQEAWLEALKGTGARVVSYVPYNTYVVRASAQAASALQALKAQPFVRFVGNYEAGFRLSPEVRAGQRPADGTPVAVTVQVIDDEEAGATIDAVRALASSYVGTHPVAGFQNVRVVLDAAQLEAVAKLDGVFAVERRTERRRLDEAQGQIVAGNLSGGSPTGPGYLSWLSGKGFTSSQFTTFSVGVTDDAYSLQGHPDLPAGRVAFENNPSAQSGNMGGHGFLNSHIIGGYNASSGTAYEDATGYNYGLGIAPFARVGVTAIFGNTSATATAWESAAYGQTARISSNSWGYTGTAAKKYDANAQEFDVIVRDAQAAAGLQQMAIVFAAGNDGSSANTVSSPATAKNVITVGASENFRQTGSDGCGIANTGADNAEDIISFSSRGPVNLSGGDGRVKPDLVAPGTHVEAGIPQSSYDGSSVCNQYWPAGQTLYGWSSGTSHSCPAVAGGAALVYQSFLNQSLTAPSPAMVKAFLMNSASYMTGVGANDTLPSNSQGMGRMNLGRAFDSAPRILVDQTQVLGATGALYTKTGSIASSTTPFRVTLAWTDAPGPTTGAPWVNNLDLEVTVGGTTYKGNVFSGASSISGGTADVKNNVESVFLPAGVSGSFTVTVRATGIAGDGLPGNADTTDQDFALIVYNGTEAAPTQPAIGLSPASLTFNAVAGGASPATQDVAITNTGVGTLAWTVSSGATWLTTTPASGTAPSTLTVQASSAGLSAGTYSGTLTVTATGASNTPQALPVTLVVAPAAVVATYDATFKTPTCATVGNTCIAGTSLLGGRAFLGPEPNQPNTIDGSCADGTWGHTSTWGKYSSESVESLTVSTTDGSDFAPGKTVRIDAEVKAPFGSSYAKRLNLYFAADATKPSWTLITSQTATSEYNKVFRTLSATYTLPTGGSRQAVRANLSATTYDEGACSLGNYDDRDDVVFSVGASSDTTPPATSITSPADGATVGGVATVSANATDDLGVARVELYVDGALSDTQYFSPYRFQWDTEKLANGAHALITTRAYDSAGNSATSTAVSVTVFNPTTWVTAWYDPTLRAPACDTVGSTCVASTYSISGRAELGPERNQPNTINGSCADGKGGTYHSDESLEELAVSTTDGSDFAPGKTVLISAKVYALSNFEDDLSSDKLDLYFASDATTPTWNFITTLTPRFIAGQKLSATYTLPAGGSRQAVRANFRRGGSAGACTTGYYDDRDDIVFAAQTLPNITSALAAPAVVGQPFSYALTATGTTPLTFGASGMPPWATIDPTTGVLSGTPDSEGTTSVTLTATNAAGSDSKTLVLTARSLPVITSPLVASALVGEPFSYTLTATGTAPITFAASGLPSWAIFNSTTGLISGTPHYSYDEGTRSITLTATNAAGSVAKTLVLTVRSLPVITSTLAASAVVDRPFGYATKADGTDPITFGASGLPSWASFDSATGVISGTPDAEGSSSITLTATNAAGSDSKTLILTVRTLPVITSTLAASAVVGRPFSYTLTATGTDPITLGIYNFMYLPSWARFDSATGVISGTPTETGTTYLRLTATNAAGSDAKEFVLTVRSLPAITSRLVDSATVGEPFSYTLTATGSAPITYTATQLPSWATFKAATGVISGTPNAEGSTSITLTATNTAGSDSKTLVLTARSRPHITSALAASAVVGQPFSYTVTATGSAPITFAASGVPAWAVFDSATGAISGTPPEAGTTSITLSATNDASSDFKTLVLTVRSLPVITSRLVDSAIVGEPFLYSTNANGTFPITFGASGLPPWAAINESTGVISGTPNAEGSTSITLTATNAAGSDSKTLVLTTRTLPVITNALAGHGAVGLPFNLTFTATGTPVITFSADGVPAGLSASDATLSGTPTAAGSFSVTETATNLAGSTTATIVLEVREAIPAPTIAQPTEGGSVNTTTPTLSGSASLAEAGNTVQLSEGGTVLCSAVIESSGNWSCSSSELAPGAHTVTAVLIDTRGLTGTSTDTQSFTVDVTVPAAPAWTGPAAQANLKDATPELSGEGESGALVTVTREGEAVCTATVDPEGLWACSPSSPLPDGPVTLTASQTDAAGNTSATASRGFTVDGAAPNSPTVTGVPADGGRTADATPSLEGTAEPRTTIAVKVDGVGVCTTTAGADGHWACPPTATLPDGLHAYSVTATDVAGNTSAPRTGSFDVQTATGALNPPSSVKTTEHGTLSGTATPRAAVNVYVNGAKVGSTTAGAEGSWNYTLPLLPAGWHRVSVGVGNALGVEVYRTPEAHLVVLRPPTDEVDGGGCSQGGSSPAGLLALLLAGLLRVRARRGSARSPWLS